MTSEYWITYKHTNGTIIPFKQVQEADLGELHSSSFVQEIIAQTEIDFDNYKDSRIRHLEVTRIKLVSERTLFKTLERF